MPLAVSFAAVGWMMILVCRFQLGSRLSWREVFLFPLVCLTMTACVHTLAIVVLHGIMDRQENFVVWTLILTTWIPVVWVPSLVVLGMDKSIWVAGMLPLIVVLIACLLHHWSNNAAADAGLEGDLQSLFRIPSSLAWRQTLIPALFASLTAQFGLLALMRRWDWTAGWLLAIALLLPAWRFPRKQRNRTKRSASAVVIASMAALILTTMALVPFLKPGPGQAALARLLMMEQMKAAVVGAHAMATGAGYPGIILVMPAKPHEAVLPAAPNPALAANHAKPVEIEFDGVYWFFKEPDVRPGRDAKTVPGDPLKARVQSTNRLPLLMEAHQPIVPAVDLSCCSVVEVNMLNGDVREGAISVEVILRDTETKGDPAISLGTSVIASSVVPGIDPKRPPVQETLSFRIPRSARLKACNEITVRIKAAKQRELAGSQVSVKSFVLLP